MSDRRLFEMQAELYKSLAHPLRIEVLNLLKKGELCFTDMLEHTGGLKSNLSQHLAIMTKNQILDCDRRGQCNYYSIRNKKVLSAYKLMLEVLQQNIKEQHSLLSQNN